MSGERDPFRPVAVERNSAADQIAMQLRDALVGGQLRPGDRLASEPELADEFKVSRATVREALRILRAQGNLRTTRGAKGGHFIISPRTDVLAESVGHTYGLWLDTGDISIAEVDEARLCVERACVRLAAQRRSTDDLAMMRRTLDESKEPGISLKEFLEADVRFHRQIARAAKNRLLELPMTAIHILRPKTNVLIRHHDRTRVAAQHGIMCDAIARGDPDAAERALLEHVGFLDSERKAALAARHLDDIPIAALDGDVPEPASS